jgi:hypothetical protein
MVGHQRRPQRIEPISHASLSQHGVAQPVGIALAASRMLDKFSAIASRTAFALSGTTSARSDQPAGPQADLIVGKSKAILDRAGFKRIAHQRDAQDNHSKRHSARNQRPQSFAQMRGVCPCGMSAIGCRADEI